MSITASSWAVLSPRLDETRLIDLLNQRLGQELYVEVEAIRAIVDTGTETAQTLTVLPAITDATAIQVTQTWNTGGTTFKAISVAITNTASAAGSLLASYTVGGTVMHSVSYAGNGYFAGTMAVIGTQGIGTAAVANYGLIVQVALSGSVTQYGIVSNSTFGSGSTTSGMAFYGQVITAAAAFTMVNGYGAYIDTPVKGAASAITNVYGTYWAAQSGGATLNIVWYAATTTNASSLTQAGLLTIGAGVTVTTADMTLVAGDVILATGKGLTNGTTRYISTPTGSNPLVSFVSTGGATFSGAVTVNAACQLGAAAGVNVITIGGTAYGAGVASLRLNGLTSGAGANVGTLTNSPHTGNPAFWIPVSVDGTVLVIPAFATT